ncbi:MAG: phage baseplate assembly protein V [Lachnospiraceae bacterium]|nr:phage baseplate assembly protein V [Lachnospiraceae bacterium]
MGLYDVIDEIAKKDITKTETGDSRILGVVIGEVVKNHSETLPGRVCVTVPIRDKEANELKWARVAMPSSGKDWGHYFLPEIGDQVLVAFEQGNIEKPFIIGCVPKDADSFFKKSQDKDNNIKRIVTRHGSTLRFDDSDDGEKEKITLETAGEAHIIVLDNEKKTISIKNKDGSCGMEMNTEKGTIEIKDDKKITIKSGDSQIIMDGNSKSILIKADSIELKATKSLKLSSDGETKVSGQAVTAEATGQALNLKSGTSVSFSAPSISM